MNAVLKGQTLQNVNLAPYTTWHVGGPATRIYQPLNVQDLSLFLQQLPKNESLFWLGLGSNVLIRDQGIKGTVILTHGGLKSIQKSEDGLVRVEAGVPCPKVARQCARWGLTGVEFLAGIPGSMGGALEMNAGAFGGETWKWVHSVEMMDRQGKIITRYPQEFEVSYREVKRHPHEWFVAALLKPTVGDAEQALSEITQLLKKRANTQPIGLFSAGSVFRNPPHYAAAQLIEACGLKGAKMGDAVVSEKHANFIINEGQAKASDIECLMQQVVETVEAKTGIHLIPEVKVVGD